MDGPSLPGGAKRPVRRGSAALAQPQPPGGHPKQRGGTGARRMGGSDKERPGQIADLTTCES